MMLVLFASVMIGLSTLANGSIEKIEPRDTNLDGLTTSNPGLENYTMVAGAPYYWLDATPGIRCTLTGGVDEGYQRVNLPFIFEFYDANYTSIYVCVNGFASFNAIGGTSYNILPFPTATWSNMLAPFWSDLYANTPVNIFVRNFTAPNRVVIEWQNIQAWAFMPPYPIVGTFEIVLYENSTIDFNYDNIIDASGGYTCGLNYGLNTSYFSRYPNLNSSVNDFRLQFYIPIPSIYAPELTLGSVSPSTGSQATAFNYSALYTDQDNNAPQSISALINGTAYPMQKVLPSDTNYVDGCLYQFVTYLQPGSYNYSFECSDGAFSNNTVVYSGPTVSAMNAAPPVLTNGNVSPSNGINGTDIFRFRVNYTDPDNNQPTYVTVAINGTEYSMAKENGLDTNFMDGCIYIYNTLLNQPGNYTYYFNASDGVNLASDGPFTNLAVQAFITPFFDGLYIDHLYMISLIGTDGSSRFSYHKISETIYDVTWNSAMFGIITYTVDIKTRMISNSSQTTFMPNNNHVREWIPTNVTLGTQLPISIAGAADHIFNVTGQTICYYPAIGMVDVWILDDLSSSYYAWYEKSTGILLNGSFPYSMWYERYTFVNTNAHVVYNNIFLQDPSVSPINGSTTTSFNFLVQYFDPANVAPTSVQLYLDAVPHAMTPVNASDTDYTDGAWFQYTNNTMSAGTHQHRFRAFKGGQTFWYPYSGGNIQGPYVMAYEFSRIHDGTVEPAWYDETVTYTFSVVYQDTLNNTPAWVHAVLDGTSYMMAKDLASDDFTTGVRYTYQNSSMVAAGHRFYFEANNSTMTLREPSSGQINGPTVILKNFGSIYNATAPTIDGVLGVNEWNDAFSYTGQMNVTGMILPVTPRIVNYTIYIMNDNANLYMAIVIKNETYNGAPVGDWLMMYFDDDMDGSLEPNEQAWSMYTNPAYSTHDMFWNGSSWVNDTDYGGTEDGDVAITHTNPVQNAYGNYVFEFWMPYASMDAHDLQLLPGSQFGFKMIFLDYNTMFPGFGMIPQYSTALIETGNLTLYGTITLDTYTSPPTSNHPVDFIVLQNATSASIHWQLQTRYSIGQYRVLRNGTVIQGWQAWPGNNTDINFPVDTGIGLRAWDYRIEFSDNNSAGTPDDVIVRVNDLPIITGGSAINNTAVPQNATTYTIPWTITDTYGTSGSYQVYLNGVLYAPGSWTSGSGFTIPIDTNRGLGTFNYTIRYMDRFLFSGQESHVFVIVVEPPTSNHPIDFIVLQNATGAAIHWQLQTRYSIGQYRVLRNGTVIQTWQAWPGNNTDINFPVDTGIGLRAWDYRIEFSDNMSAGTPDDVIVRVNDLPTITGGSAINNTAVPRNATTYSIPWTITDTYGASGSYQVYLNGVLYAPGSWTSGSGFTIPVDTNRGLGTFNYTIRYMDRFLFSGQESHVFVTVVEPPTSNTPSDTTVLQNSTTGTINWKLFDKLGAGQYRVLRNGTVVVSWMSWVNNTWINVSVATNIGFDRWNYTIQYNNSWGISGIQDVIIITVDDTPYLVASPVDFYAGLGTSSIQINWTMNDRIAAGHYTVFMNNAPYATYINVAWMNGVPIHVNVDTSTIGTFNYTLKFWDSNAYNGIQNEVDVTINSLPAIAGVPPTDLIILQDTTSVQITWTLVDSTGPGNYTILRNGIAILGLENVPWLNNTPIIVNVDTTTVGIYTYTIVYSDSFSLTGIPDLVQVTIDDLPIVLDFSGDVQVTTNSSATISWRLQDGIGEGFFTILRDGIPLAGSINVTWQNNTDVIISVDTNDGMGVFNYTIIFWDSNGFRGNQSTIMVTVVEGTRNFFTDLGQSWWFYMIAAIGIVIGLAASIGQAKKKRARRYKESLPDIGYYKKKAPQYGYPGDTQEIPEDSSTPSQMVAPAVEETSIPPETTEEPEEPISRQEPESMVQPVKHQVRFFCLKCHETYNIDDFKMDQWYICPNCNIDLSVIKKCQYCGKIFGLKKNDYIKSAGLHIPCPSCGKKNSV